MLEARVKASYRYSSVQACGGHEFIKSEFRPVPLGTELSLASYRDSLEIRERGTDEMLTLEAKPRPQKPTPLDVGTGTIAGVLDGNVKTVVARVKEAEEIATLLIAEEFEAANKNRSTVLKAIKKRVSELMAKDDEVDPDEE